MFILHVFLFLVFLSAFTDTQDLEVVGSGIGKLRRNDMIVSFFVSVNNIGDNPRRVMATMVECCETISDGEQDCDLIDLYGGDFGVIQPGSLRNFTLIYPNLYGYNRRGYCLVNIIHRSIGHQDVAEMNHRIEFDTRISPDAVPSVLEGWYDPETLIPCETPDLDPLDHCNPVDCHLKYSGYRNYYNQKVKMCQRTPICLTNLDKDLPDIVYMPITNQCLNLERGLTKNDIAGLAASDADLRAPDQMVDIRCHHGEVDPRTGLCVCDYGWKSEPFNPESYVPGQTIYSMCTIKCPTEEGHKHLPALAGLVLAMWLLFLVFCCEKNNLFRGARKSEGRSSPQVVYYPLQGGTPSVPSDASDVDAKKGKSLKKLEAPCAAHFSTTMLNKPLVKTKRKKLFFFDRSF